MHNLLPEVMLCDFSEFFLFEIAVCMIDDEITVY